VNLIRISLAASLLAAMAAPASAAQADDAFKAFKQVCGDTRADYAAVLAAASQNGWKNTDIMGSTMPGVAIADKAARIKTAGDASLILSVTRGTANNGAVKVATCTVQTDRGGYPALSALAQSWLGFAPHDTSDTKATFRFTEDGAALRAVADTEMDAAAAGAGMEILTVKREGNNATLDFVKFKK
jgi:hypothetical protein